MGLFQTAAAMQKDANQQSIQAPYGIQLYDATAGTTVKSPKGSIGTSGSAQAFTVPTGAVFFVFRCSAAGRYGFNATLDAATDAKSYKVADAETDIRVPCAGHSTIYVCAESSTITVDFFFEMLAAP